MAYKHNYILYNYVIVLTHYNHVLTYSFPHKSINYTKISSCGLINEYEKFNLNHSIKNIFSQKYFMNTIHITIPMSLFMCYYSHITIHVSILTCHYSHKPGTIFNSPNNRTVGCSQWVARGQPTHQTSVPLGGTEFHTYFQSPTHQNTIYCHGLPKWVPKIFTLRFQDLGPIKRPLTASNQHKYLQNT